MNMICCSLDPTWAKVEDICSQLCTLTCIAWSDESGTCHFPYKPLTQLDYWEKVVRNQWSTQEMISWVALVDTSIVAHVALVKKDGYYELGRWVSYNKNPKGTVTNLCRRALNYASTQKWHVLVEATQAHTASQYICSTLGLRFAGIGFLDEIDGINWDIIYFDNLKLSEFQPVEGFIANPLGVQRSCSGADTVCLHRVHRTLSQEKGGQFPPSKFHVLPSLYPAVEGICRLNT